MGRRPFAHHSPHRRARGWSESHCPGTWFAPQPAHVRIGYITPARARRRTPGLLPFAGTLVAVTALPLLSGLLGSGLRQPRGSPPASGPVATAARAGSHLLGRAAQA